MGRLIALFTAFAMLLGALPWLAPVAKTGLRFVAAHDDPVAIADLALAQTDPAVIVRGLDDAVKQDDAALAQSYIELADARHIPVPGALRAQAVAMQGAGAEALRTARDFGAGFITGQPEGLAGLAGAATSDLMVWGDIRDASREGLKLARGEEADQLLLGLSAVGLAVTAGTYATFGASLPVRAGISLVKAAKTTGRLSAALARTLTHAVKEAVDFAALARMAKAPAAVDKAALKSVVRPDRLAGLTRMLDDVALVQSKAGTRAALEGLRVADNAGDLKRLARLSEAKGGQTLAILKTLGRGAVVVTALLVKLAWWALAAACYAFALVSSFNAFCVGCARLTWRRRRRRGEARASDFPAPPAGRSAMERVPVSRHRENAPGFCVDAFSSREPVSAAPESAIATPSPGSPAVHTRPGEGPPCPISPPTASTSPISTRASAIRCS